MGIRHVRALFIDSGQDTDLKDVHVSASSESFRYIICGDYNTEQVQMRFNKFEYDNRKYIAAFDEAALLNSAPLYVFCGSDRYFIFSAGRTIIGRYVKEEVIDTDEPLFYLPEDLAESFMIDTFQDLSDEDITTLRKRIKHYTRKDVPDTAR